MPRYQEKINWLNINGASLVPLLNMTTAAVSILALYHKILDNG
jgi:hypothetical protein